MTDLPVFFIKLFNCIACEADTFRAKFSNSLPYAYGCLMLISCIAIQRMQMIYMQFFFPLRHTAAYLSEINDELLGIGTIPKIWYKISCSPIHIGAKTHFG